jgi:parallel beta-helix repeat protein
MRRLNRVRQIRISRVGVISIILLIAALTVSGVGGAGAQDNGAPAKELDSCTTINESGRYELTTDIADSGEETCIEITANDVILDGNGHTIDGNVTDSQLDEFTATLNDNINRFFTDRERSRVGVSIGSSTAISNVRVRNLTVSDWRFGISYESVSGGRVRDVTALNNGDGIAAHNSSDVSFVHSTAAAGARGFVIDSRNEGTSEENTITNVESRSNALDGISISETTDVTVTESQVSGNHIGIFLTSNTDYAIVSDTEINENTAVGVLSRNSTRQQFTNLRVTNTKGTIVTNLTQPPATGAFVFNNTGNSRTEDSVAYNNQEWAFYSDSASANTTITDLKTNVRRYWATGAEIRIDGSAS